MPIFVCLAIAGIFYYLLSEFLTDNRTRNNEFKETGELIKCHMCNKEIDKDWRYCPFCGFDEREGEGI